MLLCVCLLILSSSFPPPQSQSQSTSQSDHESPPTNLHASSAARSGPVPGTVSFSGGLWAGLFSRESRSCKCRISSWNLPAAGSTRAGGPSRKIRDRIGDRTHRARPSRLQRGAISLHQTLLCSQAMQAVPEQPLLLQFATGVRHQQGGLREDCVRT